MIGIFQYFVVIFLLAIVACNDDPNNIEHIDNAPRISTSVDDNMKLAFDEEFYYSRAFKEHFSKLTTSKMKTELVIKLSQFVEKKYQIKKESRIVIRILTILFLMNDSGMSKTLNKILINKNTTRTIKMRILIGLASRKSSRLTDIDYKLIRTLVNDTDPGIGQMAARVCFVYNILDCTKEIQLLLQHPHFKKHVHKQNRLKKYISELKK